MTVKINTIILNHTVVKSCDISYPFLIDLCLLSSTRHSDIQHVQDTVNLNHKYTQVVYITNNGNAKQEQEQTQIEAKQNQIKLQYYQDLHQPLIEVLNYMHHLLLLRSMVIMKMIWILMMVQSFVMTMELHPTIYQEVN